MYLYVHVYTYTLYVYVYNVHRHVYTYTVQISTVQFKDLCLWDLHGFTDFYMWWSKRFCLQALLQTKSDYCCRDINVGPSNNYFYSVKLQRSL